MLPRRPLPRRELARDFPCSLPLCSRCRDQKRQRFGDQGRLLRSLHFQRVLSPHHHLSAVSRLDPGERDAQPDARTSRDRREEANLVDPVVQPGRGVARDDTDLHRQRGHHCERQITVGDGSAERAFPLRPFGVDMNPLVIAGTGRKRVDPRLVDRNPTGNTEFMSNFLAQTGKGEAAHAFLLNHSRLHSDSYPYRSRSSFLLIFPTLVFGMLSTNRIFSGIPYFEMMPLSANTLRWSLIAASLTPFAPDARLTTSASGRSPHLSSLTPMTAASETPAHCEIRSSICNDDTHSPPVLITSLIRSVMCTEPLASTTAISLVCRYPPAQSCSEPSGLLK